MLILCFSMAKLSNERNVPNYMKQPTYIANPITVGKSVIIVENSAIAQLKYLDRFEENVCAWTCDKVNFE